MNARNTVRGGLQLLRSLAQDWEGGSPVIVGGAIRDTLLNRPTRDADIAVPGDCAAFAARAAALLGTRVVEIGNEDLAVHHLPLADGAVDIVQMQGSLASDLSRRDLTINSLAVPLGELSSAGLAALKRNAVIDQHGGLADLDDRIVRFTAPRVVTDDPLRTLRAVRIATELGFRVDARSQQLITADAARLATVSEERVGAEIERLFSLERVHDGVALLDATGLLDVIFPELVLGRGVEQRPLHVRDVYHHGRSTLEWMDVLLSESAPGTTPHSELWLGLWSEAGWNDAAAVRGALASQEVALRLAALLHDVGKPSTRTVDDSGRTHFFGHADLGAEMVAALCQRWRLPNSITTAVENLVRHHLRPGQIAAPGQPPTSRALFRFHRELEDAVAPLCWLFLADSLATVDAATLLSRWVAYVGHVHGIIEWTPSPQAAALRPLVDGHAVMRATGMSAGPALGRVLELIQEAIVANEVVDEESALALASQLASQETRSTGGRS